MKKTLFTAVMLLLNGSMLYSQVAVNGAGDPPHPSSMLDVSSYNRGFLLPRMSMAEFQSISLPAKGLLVYCVDDNHFYVNRGAPASPSWVMVNTEWGTNGTNIFFSGNNLGIGTSNPSAKLDVRSNSPDDGVIVQIANGDLSHHLQLFGGRLSQPNPFLKWKQGDPLSFMTDEGGGSEKMRITSDGRIGIGTNTPLAKLHVAHNGSGYTGIFGASISGYDAGANVSIGDANYSSVLYIGQSSSYKGFINWAYDENPDDAFFSIGTYSGLVPLILQPIGGHVGIGTSTPVSVLDLYFDPYSFSHFGYTEYQSNYLYHEELSSDGSGQSALYIMRASDGNDGSSYSQLGSNSAAVGYCFSGDKYSFGLAGYNNHDDVRSGGTLGASDLTTYWGALSYKDSGSNGYGGYFSSSTTGSGKCDNQPSTGIGIGAWGDLLGANIHGKIYGLYAEGGNYAVFADGVVYNNDLEINLQDNGTDTRTALYTNTSTDATVMTCGTAVLTGGRADIAFDPAFSSSVSPEEPVIVTVTPTGNSNGVFLSGVSKKGFTVMENNGGRNTVTVNFIAVGKRAGFEHPKPSGEVMNAGYTETISRGLHNDADTQTSGRGLYYERDELVAGVHSSMVITPDQAGKKVSRPEPAMQPGRNLNSREAELIGKRQ